jgi:hypothetical protein
VLPRASAPPKATRGSQFERGGDEPRVIDSPRKGICVSQRKTTTRVAFGATALGFLRAWAVYDELPQTVASHYAADGTPDGMSSKADFFLYYGLTVAFVFVVMVGSTWMIEKLPARYINLPHKEYWLESGRLPEAREKINDGMWSMTAATMLLLVGVQELVLQANLARSGMNGLLMWIMFGAYMIFSFVWTAKLLTAFTPPEGQG